MVDIIIGLFRYVDAKNGLYTLSTTQSTSFQDLPMHIKTDTSCMVAKMAARCGDGVKVAIVASFLSWLVFEFSIPTYTCFRSSTNPEAADDS